jgi:ABC-type arginine transport system permease subunit
MVLCFVVGFGEWYLITWFITSESDPLKWNMVAKIIYLIFSGLTTEGLQKMIINNIDKNDNDE